MNPLIHIAIPAYNEAHYLPKCLKNVLTQTYPDFKIWVCVNQPDDYWNSDEKLEICKNNLETLEYLKNFPEINTIDRASKGCGWKAKQKGVGMARKTLMDSINSVASDEDIIVSLDADTEVTSTYLSTITEAFYTRKEMAALSVPYYHKLTGDNIADRAMLRYEFYMRSYSLNLWRIGCPNPFTALGSAIALKVKYYRKVRGIDPKMSGEDFYFLLKLSKAGYVGNWCRETVFPATRFSERVIFGTGPAMIQLANGIELTYPIYHYSLFDIIGKFYLQIPELYNSQIENEFNDFLIEQFSDTELWRPIRKNFPTLEKFSRAVHQKADRLKILQFLKNRQSYISIKNETIFQEMLQRYFSEICEDSMLKELDFKTSSIDMLDRIRNNMYELEMQYAKNNFYSSKLI